MKKATFFLVLTGVLFCTSVIYAQSSLSISASQLYAGFKFTDSNGSQLKSEYQGIFTGSYGINYQYLTDFGLLLKPGLGMRTGGSSLVYDDMNYAWELQYTDFRLGIGYLYKIERIHPYLITSGYYSYMLRGTQTLNNQDFNIIESELLKNNDFGIQFNPGVEFELSDNLGSFIEFTYMLGLNNIEKNENQKTTNFAYGITLGLSLNITK